MQITIIIILVIITNILCIKLFLKKNISPILILSIWFAVFIWYSIPGLICVFFPIREANSIFFKSISSYDFLQGYMIESFGIILVLLLVLTIRTKKSGDTSLFLAKLSNRQKYYFIALFCFIIVINFYSKSAMEFDYLSANSADSYDSASIFSRITYIVDNILLSIAILIGIYETDRRIVIIILILIFLDTIPTLLSGGRFDSLRILFVFIIRIFQQNIKLSIYRVVFVGLVLFLAMKIIIPVFTFIQDNRANGIAVSEIFQESSGIISNNLIASGIFFKLDSFSTGVLLVQNQGLGAGGILPYIGATFVFIPRKFFPNRPISGSFDGTIYGHPSRVVPQSIGIVNDSMNVGVSPIHIALWQLGYVGLFIFIFANFFYLKLINIFLISENFVHRIIGIIVLSIPTFDSIFPSPDVVLRNIVNVAIVLFIIFIIKSFWQQKKNI